VKLFKPYSFVTSGWVQKSGVSGLGLSMAKRYVEGAGGTIGVEFAEGKGSTLFFSIPFPLMNCDPSINHKPSQSFSDSSLALSEKVELSNSLPSSGVTHDTTANGMLNTGREEPRAGNNGITQKVTDIAKLDGGSFQRKVLLVEDTCINRVSTNLLSLLFLPVFSLLIGDCRVLAHILAVAHIFLLSGPAARGANSLQFNCEAILFCLLVVLMLLR